MECALATFSLGELEKMLREVGYEPGTQAFRDEMSRRYTPSEEVPGKFVERDDWKEDFRHNSIRGGQFDPEAHMRSGPECAGKLYGQGARELYGRGYNK